MFRPFAIESFIAVSGDILDSVVVYFDYSSEIFIDQIEFFTWRHIYQPET